MLTSIAGRSVVVTGASKGIGKGIAQVFAAQGAKILVVARHLDDAEAVAAAIRGHGGVAVGCIRVTEGLFIDQFAKPANG